MMRVNEVLDTVDDGGAWQLIALSQVRLNVVCELLGHHRPHQSAQGNRDVPPSAEKQKDRDRNASGRRGRRRKRRPRSSDYRADDADDTKCGQTWDNAISCGAWYRLENCEPKRGTAIRDNQNGDQLVVPPCQ